MRYRKCFVAIGLFVGLQGLLVAQEGASSSQDNKIAALKETLHRSAEALKQYEWIETTTVSMDGEQKSTEQHRCYYGVDGKLTKIPIGSQPDQKTPHGLRGKIAKHKKAEITDTVETSVALVKQYVPPDPAKIEAAKGAGRLWVNPGDAGKLGIKIADYQKSGDSLLLGVDAASNHLNSLVVDSYTNEKEDTVHLDVTFSTLNDGTNYASRVVLSIKAHSLQIAIENSGYRKSAKTS